MEDLEITGVIIGGFLTAIFIGYIVLEEYSSQAITRSYSRAQLFAGSFTVLIGLIMLAAWIYFLAQGRESFLRDFTYLVAHVVLELVSAVALIVAGAYMLLGRWRAPALLMTAYTLLVFTQVFSLLVYGVRGHPFLMNGIAIILIVVLTYFIGVAYAWEHFVFRLDRPESRRSETDEGVSRRTG